MLVASSWIVASFTFSFVLWRGLREDYPFERIFLLTLLLLASGGFGYFLSQPFFPQYSFLVSLVFSILVGLYTVKKLEFRFFDTLDSLVAAWLWFLLLSSIGYFLSTDIVSFARNATIALVALLLYLFFLKRYRSFGWYPSGKVGFVGLGSLASYFLISSSVSFVFALFLGSEPPVTFAAELVNAIIGVVVFLLLAGGLYLRSGRERANRLPFFRS